MFTEKEAEALGWTFAVDGEDGVASKDGEEMLQVTSGIPLFAMLSEVADREGQGPLVRTPEVILAASGETYEEPPVAPVPVAVAVEDALVGKLAAGTASDVEVQQALARVLGG